MSIGAAHLEYIYAETGILSTRLRKVPWKSISGSFITEYTDETKDVAIYDSYCRIVHESLLLRDMIRLSYSASQAGKG